MIRITRLTNRYGKCGASVEFEEANDAALYLWGKMICEFLITKDGHKFETASTNIEDIESELNNFVDGWDMAPRKNLGRLNQFSFTVTADTERLNGYENKLIALLAEYNPYTTKDIESVYAKCGKSFDKTARALYLGKAWNSIDDAIKEVNKQ